MLRQLCIPPLQNHPWKRPQGDADCVKTPVGFPDIHAGDMLSHGTYLR